MTKPIHIPIDETTRLSYLFNIGGDKQHYIYLERKDENGEWYQYQFMNSVPQQRLLPLLDALCRLQKLIILK